MDISTDLNNLEDWEGLMGQIPVSVTRDGPPAIYCMVLHQLHVAVDVLSSWK